VAGNDTSSSRRSFLMIGLAAAAGTVVNALGRPASAAAADGDPVIAGQTVAASSTTQIHATNEGALIARTDATGSAAIDGQSTGGSANIGVRGSADGQNSTGVLGHSGDSIGVAGSSDTRCGHGNDRQSRSDRRVRVFARGDWC
jgi:hypothetical protein